MLFLSSLDNSRCIYYFSKRCWWFWDRAQNMLFSGYPLNNVIPLECFQMGSKCEPVKLAGGKMITMLSTGAIIWPGSLSEVRSYVQSHPHTLCANVYQFCVIQDVCLCSVSQLPGCTIATCLLLPPVPSAEVMWNRPIRQRSVTQGWAGSLHIP